VREGVEIAHVPVRAESHMRRPYAQRGRAENHMRKPYAQRGRAEAICAERKS